MRYPEEKLERMAKNYGLNITFGANIIFVKTKVSSWRLIHNGTKVTKIYHEKYRRTFNDLNKFDKNYHIQKLKNYSYASVFEYISKHDKQFLKRKSRIDILFSQLDKNHRSKCFISK